MSNKERIMELRRGLQKKAIPFHNVFSSPEGQEILDALRAEFCPAALCTDSPHETIVRAAQRDVIEYIEIMIKLREVDYK